MLNPNITFNFGIFTAVGCPDMTAPDYGWFKRTEDGASVGCTNTDEEWQLRCSGSSWVGHMGNCSASKEDISFKFIKGLFVLSQNLLSNSSEPRYYPRDSNCTYMWIMDCINLLIPGKTISIQEHVHTNILFLCVDADLYVFLYFSCTHRLHGQSTWIRNFPSVR